MRAHLFPALVVGALSLCIASPVLAAGPVRHEAPGTLSPQARGELTRRFVMKWGNYVQRVYEVPVGTWASRMVPNFVAADPANFRRAMQRDTFEAAVADLSGAGHRVGDARVIDRLARLSMQQGDRLSPASMKALGSLGSDLTYTPITPCRIVDTRVAGGVIAANSTRSFKAINSANFTAQGGSATNCGTLGINASGVVINITAVTPSIAGYATVYPFGAAQPLAASVNYTAGAIVNNAITTAIPNPLQSSDFTVFTFAQAHYVIDIVGYFAPPVATALECNETFVSQAVAANATFDIDIPNCAAGYTITGAGCRTPGFNQADWAINGLYRPSAGVMDAFCSGQNKTASSITVEGTARCCRVPGR
ncbi:MAG: hypothetical protein JNM58_08210 [Xanthomonadaceae bacterium]|nr:hypothetical protein [Xanthomonadaceae bacterium]